MQITIEELKEIIADQKILEYKLGQELQKLSEENKKLKEENAKLSTVEEKPKV